MPVIYTQDMLFVVVMFRQKNSIVKYPKSHYLVWTLYNQKCVPFRFVHFGCWFFLLPNGVMDLRWFCSGDETRVGLIGAAIFVGMMFCRRYHKIVVVSLSPKADLVVLAGSIMVLLLAKGIFASSQWVKLATATPGAGLGGVSLALHDETPMI
jgi:hypothetical protein